MNKKEKGLIGEFFAREYLFLNKYKIIENNFSSKFGEIDIIASKDNELIFIEVKTRSSREYGCPANSVNTIKQSHIKRTAKYFLYKNFCSKISIRFDVIEVYVLKKGFFINHIKNVFW